MTSSVADGYLGPVLIGNGLRQALLSTAVTCQVYGHVVVVPLRGWGVGGGGGDITYVYAHEAA